MTAAPAVIALPSAEVASKPVSAIKAAAVTVSSPRAEVPAFPVIACIACATA